MQQPGGSMVQVGTGRDTDLTPEQQDPVRRAWHRWMWLFVAPVPVCGVGGLVGVGGSLLLARRQYTRPGRVRSAVAAGDAVPADDRELAQAHVGLLPRRAATRGIVAAPRNQRRR